MNSNSILLGRSSDNKPVTLDVPTLIRTRMLVQANSGGGKSWFLRRLAEQLHLHVPVIILDPEGEFATLREKFNFVLVGKDGETPADCRSAALVAHRLLELRASAVCDLYEMKPAERHRWVRLFLDACIDAPKQLWRPTVFIGDELHTFCPEKGAGESEASEACIGMGTRGRKRGFCFIAATQRIGKLRKDLAAELLNVMIGPTFIDIDRKRAAECLGVPGAEVHSFFDEIKVLQPGHFFALGRAIALERTRMIVGDVETTHPEAGAAQHAMEAPPAPAKIKALLPKLADLPKAAEDKARTEAELRADIRSLEAKLRERPVQQTPVERVKEVEVLVIKEQELKRLEAACGRLETVATEARAVVTDFAAKLAALRRSSPARPAMAARPVSQAPIPQRKVADEQRRTIAAPQDGVFDGAQQKILDTVKMLRLRGLTPNREMIARWIPPGGIHPNGGRYGSNLAVLRMNGLLDGFELTVEGEAQARATETSLDKAKAVLDGGQQAIVQVLEGGEDFSRETLAEALSIHPNGGRYGSNLARLRTMGLIPERGTIRLTEAAWK